LKKKQVWDPFASFLLLQMSGELTVKSKRNCVWDFCAADFAERPGVQNEQKRPFALGVENN
jgi:hypothetical protein